MGFGLTWRLAFNHPMFFLQGFRLDNRNPYSSFRFPFSLRVVASLCKRRVYRFKRNMQNVLSIGPWGHLVVDGPRWFNTSALALLVRLVKLSLGLRGPHTLTAGIH